MTKKNKIKFLEYLHKLEQKESAKGLFVTDSVLLIASIRKKFLKFANERITNEDRN